MVYTISVTRWQRKPASLLFRENTTDLNLEYIVGQVWQVSVYNGSQGSPSCWNDMKTVLRKATLSQWFLFPTCDFFEKAHRLLFCMNYSFVFNLYEALTLRTRPESPEKWTGLRCGGEGPRLLLPSQNWLSSGNFFCSTAVTALQLLTTKTPSKILCRPFWHSGQSKPSIEPRQWQQLFFIIQLYVSFKSRNDFKLQLFKLNVRRLVMVIYFTAIEFLFKIHSWLMYWLHLEKLQMLTFLTHKSGSVSGFEPLSWNLFTPSGFMWVV